jgi:hypothetical protein
MKTEGSVAERVRRQAKLLLLVVLGFMAIVSIWTPLAFGSRDFQGPRVAPHAGAWIETTQVQAALESLRSPLMRGRGSKPLCVQMAADHGWGDAALRGTIEPSGF